MYLNMYRAGRLNNPGRRGIARNDRSRERRQPWRIRQASSGAGRDDGEKKKIPFPSPSASMRRERCHNIISCSSSTTHAASGRSRSPGGRIRPGTRRRQAGARLKERGGRRQKAGAAWSTARTRCWPGHHPPPAVRHQDIITTTAAQRPPAVSARVFRRLLLRISEKVRRFTDIFCIF